LKPKHTSKDVLEFAEAISLNIQYIFFTLEGNDLHQRSKPVDPSTKSNPYLFGAPTDNPHQHRRKEEEDPHLHKEQSLSDYAQQDLSIVTKRYN
jgi:hypothetical protein